MRETARDDYLARQLIAYIGNKRRLIPFLSATFSSLVESGPTVSFMDPFAGSGAVARLGKSLGYAVAANDWEFYAWVVTAAHLWIDETEATRLFRGSGGIGAVFLQLNELGEAARRGEGARGYLARHYAPARTEGADYRRERLFYTAENARFLDAVRDQIEAWYPGWQLPPGRLKEKLLLVSAVLYEAATHANTSGVFKAFHKGFGGFGRDALTRILAPAHLEPPMLRDSQANATVSCSEALEFLRGRSAELCYLDPPYTIHQYGSNYHLLNTIAAWDKPAISERLGADGRLETKAGIRVDWTRTRSDYCIPSRAEGALRELLGAIDARHIVLSYNTEGLVPVERVYEMMAELGRTEVRATDYVLYRGGRQSLFRGTHNLEYLLVLRAGHPPRPTDREAMERFLTVKRLVRLLRASFVPERIEALFAVEGDRVLLIDREGDEGLSVPMPFAYRVAELPGERELERFPVRMLGELAERLASAQCRDRGEEARVLIDILRGRGGRLPARSDRALQERLAAVVRKFAHRKYRSEFEESCLAVHALIGRDLRRFALLERRLAEIERIASLRFNG